MQGCTEKYCKCKRDWQTSRYVVRKVSNRAVKDEGKEANHSACYIIFSLRCESSHSDNSNMGGAVNCETLSPL